MGQFWENTGTGVIIFLYTEFRFALMFPFNYFGHIIHNKLNKHTQPHFVASRCKQQKFERKFKGKKIDFFYDSNFFAVQLFLSFVHLVELIHLNDLLHNICSILTFDLGQKFGRDRQMDRQDFI